VGREVPALQEVSLTVESEKFVAILGPSGCGKSTLLNIIAGLLPATAGAVHFEGAGRPGAPLTPMVFEEFALFPCVVRSGWSVDNGFMKRALPLEKIVDTTLLEDAPRQVGP
jgi:ABC-type taurine transport system ATPase subunit